MQETFKRCCGKIHGNLSELLPFIYLFHRGGIGRGGDSPNNKRLKGIFAVNEFRGGGCFFKNGVILPLSTCKDERIRTTLSALQDTISFGLDYDRAAARRVQAQAILTPVFGKAIRLANKASMCGYVEFARNRAFFEMLAKTFRYLTEVMDAAKEEENATPTEFRAFPHRNYGSYLEWYYNRAGRDDRVWQHCTPSLVFDGTDGIYDFFPEKSGLVRPPSILQRFFHINPEVDDQPVSARFSMTQWGDIQLMLTVGGIEVRVDLSNACPSIESLIEWLKAIGRGDMPVQFEIDEEGTNKTFSAYPTVEYDRILFRVCDPYAEDGEPCFIDEIVNRHQLVATFKAAFTDFFLNDFDPAAWHGQDYTLREWHLGVQILADPWFQA